jgi:hypothetical protein
MQESFQHNNIVVLNIRQAPVLNFCQNNWIGWEIGRLTPSTAGNTRFKPVMEVGRACVRTTTSSFSDKVRKETTKLVLCPD